MSDSVVLRLLDQNRFCEAAREIQVLLRPTETNDGHNVKQSTTVQAARFLWKYTQVADKITDKDVLENVKAITDCFSCLRKNPIKWSNPVDLERYTGSIILKFIKADHLEAGLKLADSLISHMAAPRTATEDTSDGLAKVSNTVFSVLWNATVGENETKCLRNLKLRLTSVCMLCVGGGENVIPSALERFGQALDASKSVLEKIKDNPVSEMEACAEHIISSCKQLHNWLLSELTFQHTEVRTVDQEQVAKGSSKEDTHFQIHFRRLSVCVQILMKCVEWLLKFRRFQQALTLVEKSTEEIVTHCGKFQLEAIEQKDHSICELSFQCLKLLLQVLSAAVSRRCHQGSKGLSECKEITEQLRKPNDALLTLSDMLQNCKTKSLPPVAIAVSSMMSSVLRVVIASFVLDVTGINKAGVTMTAFSHLTLDGQSQVCKLHHCLSEFIHLELCYNLNKLMGRSVHQDTSSKDTEKLVKKCKSLQVDYIMASSDKLYIQVGMMQGMTDINSKEWTRGVQVCVKTVTHLSDFINNAQRNTHIGISLDEHMHFGFLLFKIGRVCYSKAAYDQSIPFFKLSCNHYSVWFKEASATQKEKQPIWKKYDCLCMAYKHTGQYDRAMGAICTSLFADKAHLAQACDNWQTVKIEAAKSAKHDKLQTKVLWKELSAMSKQRKITLPLTAVQVLEAELYSCKQKDSASFEARLCVVEEYIRHVECMPVEKARILLDKSELLWRKRREHNNETAESVCEQALVILKKTEASLGDAVPLPLLDTLAKAYILLYVVKDVDVLQMKKVCEERKQRRKKVEGHRGANDAQTDEIEEDDLYKSCTPIYAEKIFQEPAVKALEAWKRLVNCQQWDSDDVKDASFHDVRESVDAMMLLATIFRLSLRFKEMCEVLSMVLPLASRHSVHSAYFRAVTYLALALNTQKQPAVAMVFIRAAEDWAQRGDSKSDKILSSTEYIYLIAVKAETQLLLNKVDEGFSTLQHSISLKKTHKRQRTKEDLELEGYIRRVHARYASLPKSFWNSATLTEELAMEVMVLGVRSICGVVNSTLGSCFISPVDTTQPAAENLSEKWYLMCELLDTFAEVGSIFCQIGDAREARTHLSMGLLIAQTFHLSKRLAQFHLLLARLSNVSGKFQDSTAHLHAVHYILHSQQVPTPETGTVENITESTATGNKGGESHNVATPKRGQFEIKTKPLDYEDRLLLLGEKAAVDSPASPKHKKLQIHLPEFWQHSKGCDCVECSDVQVIYISLFYVMCYAELYLMQGKYKESRHYLNEIFCQFNKLSHVGSVHLKKQLRSFTNTSSGSHVSSQGFSQNFDIKPSSLHDIFIESCKLMTFMALIDLDIHMHREWTKRMQSCLDLDLHPWMVTSHVNMAEAGYLDSVPSLPWPKCNDQSILESICAEISKINLASDNLGLVSTPLADKKSQSRVDAPVKKKKGGGAITFVTTETPTVLNDDDSPPSRNETTSDFSTVPIQSNTEVWHDKTPSGVAAEPIREMKSKASTSAAAKMSSTYRVSASKVTVKSSKATGKGKQGARSAIPRKNILEDKPEPKFSIYKDTESPDLPPSVSQTLQRKTKKSTHRISKPSDPDINRASFQKVATFCSEGFGAANRKGTLIFNSDSDDEILQTPLKVKRTQRTAKSSKAKPTTNNVPCTTRRGRSKQEKEANAGEALKESDVLNSPDRVLQTDFQMKTAPNKAISKKEDVTENVFEFICSDSETPERPKRGRKKNVAVASRPKTSTSRNVRETKRTDFGCDAREKRLSAEKMESLAVHSDVGDVSPVTFTPSRTPPITNLQTSVCNTMRGNEEDLGRLLPKDASFTKVVKHEKENTPVISASRNVKNLEPVSASFKHDISYSAQKNSCVYKPSRRVQTNVTKEKSIVHEVSRVTRSRTKMEDQREDDWDESDENRSLNISLFYPETDSVSDESSLHQMSLQAEDFPPLHRSYQIASPVIRACSESGEDQFDLSQPRLEEPEIGVELARIGDRVTDGTCKVGDISVEEVSRENSEGELMEVDITRKDLPRKGWDATISDDEIELPRTNSDDENTVILPSAPQKSKKQFGKDKQGKSESGVEVPRKTKLKTKCQPSVTKVRGGEIKEQGTPIRNALQVQDTSNTPSTVRQQFVTTSYKMAAVGDDARGTNTEYPKSRDKKLPISEPESLKRYLCQTLRMLSRNPPSIPYRQVCQALAVLCAQENNTHEAIYYLTEAHSVVFRHNALLHISKRLRKLGKESPENDITKGVENLGLTDKKSPSIREKLTHMSGILAFNKTVEDIEAAANVLPKGWTVCQISVLTSPAKESGDMYIAQLQNTGSLGRCPGQSAPGLCGIVQRMPGFSSSKGQKILGEFQAIMDESQNSMQITESVEWWSKRRKLDERLKELLSDVDGYWLACWRCLLVGQPSNQQDQYNLGKATEDLLQEMASDFDFQKDENVALKVRQLVKAALNASHLLSDRELIAVLCSVLEQGMTRPREAEKLVDACVKRLRRLGKELNLKAATRLPVVLILDRSVQHLPWESLTFLRSHTVSRVPSLYFLRSLFHLQNLDNTSVLQQGVNPTKAYYVLNPESNLPSTEEKFAATFSKQKGWSGITGKVPTVEEYSDALSKHDLFIYCGHGGGSRYISGEMIQTLQCRACVLLMGCSSGRLTVHGNLEASGLILNYFLAGCPCVIANLWDVTDKDIDRFTDKLLRCWLAAKTGDDICRPLAECRDFCRLPSLIGAAPVVYGIPLNITRS